MIEDLMNSRELAWRLFVRDVSARYRQSVLGIFWAFLPPIVTGIVFIMLQSKNVIRFGETDIPYPVYVLVGTTLWQLFTESLNAPLQTVKSSIQMLAKINFPREALILSAFYQVLLNFLFKSIVIAAIFLYFHVPLKAGIIPALGMVFLLIALGMVVGLLLTPFGVLFTDISSGLQIATQAWFFLTPVVYPTPKSFPFSLIATLNPVSPVLSAARDLATKGNLQDGSLLCLVGLLTVAGLFVAWIFYRLAIPIIIERMSA